MKFELQVLGANSAIPLPGRFPSSFVLYHENNLYLLDCGEGTQIKMSQFEVRRSKIDFIFITHLHGDHLFGLPGLLNSFNLNGRKKKLNLFAPRGMKKYLTAILEITGAQFNFPLDIHELTGDGLQRICELDRLEVFAFPLKHRISTYGYLFKEKDFERNIRKDAIVDHHLSIEEIKRAKSGQDIERDEETIRFSDVTLPVQAGRTFAYCTDTQYAPDIIPFIENVNLLYHEATYLHELANRARDRMHSTTKEAARIAEMANVRKLLIGHYSGRYKILAPLLAEARSIFSETYLAEEGQVISIE